ncbi:MAG: MBL fold metallo-hydrolase [Anaerolineales bacterium]|nr:MBL fold metallo-hydrolase [Anaerolineales bacterium]
MKRQQIVIHFLLTLGILVSTASGCAVSTSQPPSTSVTVNLVTSTAVPPTTMPTSILVTYTAILSTPTQTSKPMISPIAPAGLHIAYVCNDGFIIVVDGRKILIDVLFHDSRQICQADSDEITQSAQPPFDNADLVLVSHSHWDHFDPQIVSEYMQNNHKAVLVAEKSAAEALSENSASFTLIQERVYSVELARRQRTQMNFSGISVEIFSAPADVPNLGFLIQVGQFTFFHSGDSGLDTEIAADFQTYQLCTKNINFAFLPYWYFLDPLGQSLLERGICAANYIPMHYAGEKPEGIFSSVRNMYPQAIFFPEEWQIWSP